MNKPSKPVTYDPAIPLLGIYPEKTIIRKDTCTTMFIAALSTITKTWKQPKCPSTDEWIKKMWCIYIYTHTHTRTYTHTCIYTHIYIYTYIHTHIYTMEYYSAIKKEIMPFSATWMDLEIIRSEISQTKTNIIWYHLYVESKNMIQMNLFTKQKQTHRHRKQIYGYQGERLGRGII